MTYLFLLFRMIIGALIGLFVAVFGLSSMLIVHRQHQREQHGWSLCRNHLPERREVAERIATAPAFVLEGELRDIADEGSDRPGILDMTPSSYQRLYSGHANDQT